MINEKSSVFEIPYICRMLVINIAVRCAGIQQNVVVDSIGIREIPDSIQQKNDRTKLLFLGCQVPSSSGAFQQWLHSNTPFPVFTRNKCHSTNGRSRHPTFRVYYHKLFTPPFIGDVEFCVCPTQLANSSPCLAPLICTKL